MNILVPHTETLPFNTIYRDHSPASLGIDRLREDIAYLNGQANEVGCVFYNVGAPTTVVIFGGARECFSMLTCARFVETNVLCFQDLQSFWYQGSVHLPDILSIAQILEGGNVGENFVLFGQSAGAYAALAASKHLASSVVVAISPQTFSDGTLKSRIKGGSSVATGSAPEGLIDLSEHLVGADRSTYRSIFFGVSETNNPVENFFWMDQWHACRMAPLPEVELVMLKEHRHPLVAGRSGVYSDLIRDLSLRKASEARATVLAFEAALLC